MRFEPDELKFLRDRQARGETPVELIDEPLLSPEAAFYFDLFVFLNGARQAGMSLNPITIEAVDAVARRLGMSDSDFWRFACIVREVDNHYRAHPKVSPTREAGRKR